jgi:hypothetical protein
MLNDLELGRATIRRWSEIEFNNVSMMWEVTIVETGEKVYESRSRASCVVYERRLYGQLQETLGKVSGDNSGS